MNCGNDNTFCSPGSGAVLGRALTKAFSYDKPSVSAMKPHNAPPLGSSMITIFGTNFGYSK
jgi:hypothetical protein